ncbi:hypothetical protein V1477_012353 [Vespula maculifrons]|uniref:Uncharacterized protein n=1 Tax=Vespula maculifrons TaxID=7453 RepID=A0ABD2BX85_VESMC
MDFSRGDHRLISDFYDDPTINGDLKVFVRIEYGRENETRRVHCDAREKRNENREKMVEGGKKFARRQHRVNRLRSLFLPAVFVPSFQNDELRSFGNETSCGNSGFDQAPSNPFFRFPPTPRLPSISFSSSPYPTPFSTPSSSFLDESCLTDENSRLGITSSSIRPSSKSSQRGEKKKERKNNNNNKKKVLLFPEEGWARSASSSYWTLTPFWWSRSRCKVVEVAGTRRIRYI